MLFNRNVFPALRLCLLMGLFVAMAAPAFGHDILTAEVAQEYLAAIARAHQQVKAGKTQELQLDGLYELGTKAFLFSNEINRDVQAHGPDSDYDLIALIQRRLQQYGVSIDKVGSAYSYDFAAFHEYLRRDPRGKHAADSRLVLVRYVDVPDDWNKLQDAATEKALFLRDFPSHPSVPSVLLGVARDQLRMSRLTPVEILPSDSKRTSSPKQMELSAKDHLQEIIRRFPQSDEAGEAREYLDSLHRSQTKPGTN